MSIQVPVLGCFAVLAFALSAAPWTEFLRTALLAVALLTMLTLCPPPFRSALVNSDFLGFFYEVRKSAE